MNQHEEGLQLRLAYQLNGWLSDWISLKWNISLLAFTFEKEFMKSDVWKYALISSRDRTHFTMCSLVTNF